MKIQCIAIATAVLLSATPARAESDTSSRNYSREQALTSRNIQEGVVVMVRDVKIANRSKVNTGSVLGAAIGFGAAQQVKNRDARNAARIVGAAAGGVAGGAIQRAASDRDGLEIFIRTEQRGRSNVISIIQDADISVQPGQSVLISGSGRDVRVIPVPLHPYTTR